MCGGYRCTGKGIEMADRHGFAGSGAGLDVVNGCSLSIQIIHDRRQVRLVPIGEIDINSASTFTIAAEFAVDEVPEHLHIDLSRVTFIDSSGVRGIDAVVQLARGAGVPCTIIGRDIEIEDTVDVARPMVVWSGSTTRLVALPKM